MLVAMAIIAVLAALSVPAFSSIRESADKAKCISNLKQMASVTMSMAADIHGKMPNWTEKAGGPWHWD